MRRGTAPTRALTPLSVAFLNGVFWLAARCSRATSWRMARWLAQLMLIVGEDTARATRTNLATCYPALSDAALGQLTKESLSHMVLLFFELAQLRYWPLERLLEDVTVEGGELLDDAFHADEGVLLLVPHYGNWELMCAYLGHFYTVAALYDRPKRAAVEQLILAARQRYDGEMFPIDTGGMRSVYRTLRRGGLVALLPDQVPDRNAGVYAPFFGKPALTMTLPHRLLTKTDATPLLGIVERDLSRSNYSYRLRFERLDRAAFADEDQAATAVNAAIERAIADAPAQYQWEYKRFKRPPEGGQNNIYRRQ